MKNTIFKSVTVFLCVLALCISSVFAFGKIGDAIVESAKYKPASTGSSSAPVADNGDVSTDVPDDSGSSYEVPSDGDSADVQAPADSSADSSAQGSDNPSAGTSTSGNSSSSSSSSSTASKKPTTQAEILNYFNTAANKIKTSAKGGTYNYEKNTQAGTFTLGGPFKMFSSAIDGLVEKNMGEVEEHKNLKMSKADLKKYVPVENESWTSKLTTSNISSATLTEKNGNYVVTIKVKTDADSTSPAHGAGNHGKAFSIVQVSTILDNAGPVKSLLDGNVKIGYRDGKIVATIDPKTGNLTHVNYYYVWILDVTVGSTNVNAPFGIESDFTINW